MAVTLKQLRERIVESGLMTDDDVEQFVAAHAENKKLKDGEQLARLLVKEQKLTAYQAKVLYRNKGKDLVLGNYIILDKLGQGGMGMVLKAEHKRMRRLVALKVLAPSAMKSPDAVQRFHREVEAAAKLEHQNIVTAYDADEANGVHFLVMHYIEGTDLSVLVKKKGPISVDRAVSYIKQAATGLEYAHSQGVVHRDIKPANLLLDGNEMVKILDMGLARIEGAAGDPAQAELTGTGMIMGTVDYMSPEQAMSTKTADARSDIYSLGISLWYLLVGKSAFEGDSLMAKMMAHQQSPIPSLCNVRREVPAGLDSIFQKMVAKKPEDRYQTMTEVIADLEQGFSTGGGASSPEVSIKTSEDSKLNAFLDGLGGESPSSPSMVTLGQTKGQTKTKAAKTRVAEANSKTLNVEAAGEDTDPQSQMSLPPRMGKGGRVAKSSAKAPLWQNRKVQIGVAAGGVLLLLLLMFIPGGGKDVAELEQTSVVPVEVAGEEGDQNGKLVTEKRVVVGATGSGSDQPIASAPLDEGGAYPGKFALSFPERKESYVEVPGLDSKLMGELLRDKKLDLTIEFWLKRDKQQISPHDIYAGWSDSYLFVRSAAGGAYVEGGEWGGRGAPPVQFYNATAPTRTLKNEAVWTHVAAVLINPTENRLFIDGKHVDKKAAEWGWAGSVDPFQLMAQASGMMGETRVSTVARYDKDFTPEFGFKTDADTLALYHFDEGTGDVLHDSSGKGHDGKIEGAEWVNVREASSDSTSGLRFHKDGTVILNHFPEWEAESFTFEAIITAEELSGNVLESSGGSLNFSPSNLCIKVSDGTEVNTREFPIGRPVHVAGVYDKGELLIFADGKLKERKSIALFKSNFTEIRFGTRGFHGTLHELRISSNARYHEDFTPPGPDQRLASDEQTFALYHFDKDTGKVLKDSSGKGHDGKIVGAKWVKLDGNDTTPGATASVPSLAFEKPGFDDWLSRVKEMPVKKQIEAVSQKMVELNPGFDGGLQPERRSGDVHTVRVNSAQATDLSPLRVWTSLRVLFLSPPGGKTVPGVGFLDLSPLRGMQLNTIFASHTRIADLAPLQGMPLQVLHLDLREVRDLTPLEGMPLEDIYFDFDSVFHTEFLRSIKTLKTINSKPAAEFWKGYQTNSPPPAIAPFDEAQAKSHQEAWAKHLGEPVVTTNSIGMKLAVIPPGEFQVTSKKSVNITLTQPFRIGIHEVTQEQWQDVMGTEPWKGKVQADANAAAVSMTWAESVDFCRKLTERERATGKLSDGWEYRLPTSAEWDFACSAGTTDRFWFGDGGRAEEFGWFDTNTQKVGEAYPHPVGLKKPNPWGLFDMYGNVWERCRDWEGELTGGTDPMGPDEGNRKICRGGSWRADVWVGGFGGARLIGRYGIDLPIRENDQGFRVALCPLLRFYSPSK